MQMFMWKEHLVIWGGRSNDLVIWGGGEAMFWVLQGLQTFYYMNSYDLIHEGYTSLRSISILSLSSLL